MSNGSIHLYLDANIFIDLVEGQSDAATNLIQLAKQRKWVYVISAFTVMEAIDNDIPNCDIIFPQKHPNFDFFSETANTTTYI